MPSVQGRLLVWETGAKLSDLVVELYDADHLSYSAFEKGELIGRRPAALRALPIHRLGSTISDRDGQFTIQYPGDDRSPPNLALVVLAPEIAGANGASKILYASSAIRESAGDTEHYVVALTKSVLRGSGLPSLALVGTADMQAVTDRLDEVRKGWRDRRPAEKRISKVYRRKAKELARTPNRGPDGGFRLAIPASGLGDDDSLPTFLDGRWVIWTGDGQPEVALDVEVVLVDDLPAAQRPSGPIGVVVDRQQRKFRVAVSGAGPPLLMAQEGPSELVLDRLRRRHPSGRSRSGRRGDG